MKQIARVWCISLTLLAAAVGCVTSPPLSESTIADLRVYYKDLMARVASGELPAEKAHDWYWAKLEATRPPLPDLNSLKELRHHLEAQIQTRMLTHEQAESLLRAKESQLLSSWHVLAVQSAQDEQEVQRLRRDYEEGYWQQKPQEQGEKVFRDRPRY